MSFENLNVNTEALVQVKILSPTHVGGDKEANTWSRGLDFFYEKNVLYEVDKKRLVRVLRANNQLDSYLEMVAKAPKYAQRGIRDKFHITPEQVALPIAKLKLDDREEIHRHYHTAQGKPTLPGSALKGVLRTVLFQQWYRNNSTIQKEVDKKIKHANGNLKRIWDQQIEPLVFGEINNNVMRLLRLTDVSFEWDQTVYHNTKILNRNAAQKFVWKHGKNDSDEEVSMKRMATAFQFLAPGATGYCRIGLLTEEKIYEQIQQFNQIPNEEQNEKWKKQLVANKKMLDRSSFIRTHATPIQQLFQWVNQLTVEYVKEEIRYYQHQLTESTLKNQDLINGLIDWLRSDILGPASKAGDLPISCILRVGQGVGFHALSGDWRLKGKHVEVLQDTLDGKQYKTRRMVMEYDGELDEHKLYTPGYVQLTIATDQDKTVDVFSNSQTEGIAEWQNAVQKQWKKEAEERLKATQVAYFKGKLKVDTEIDGIYLREDPKQRKYKIFQLLIEEEGKEQEVSVRYPASLPKEQKGVLKVTGIRKDGQEIKVEQAILLRLK